MEHLHSHLRLAASLILAAGLVGACSGGSSGGTTTDTGGGTMEPVDPEPMEPTMTRTPEDCTDASPTCTVTETAADGTTTTTVTTNMPNTAAMTNTRTVTAGGVRTTTVTSTVEAHANRVMSRETCAVSGSGCTTRSYVENTYGTSGSNTATSTLSITYDAMGNPATGERVTGTTTVNIEYSSSGGGRTETTAVTGGEQVQTFKMFSGGDATSTMVLSAGGTTVTTDDGTARTQTVYASSARVPGTERTVTTGTAATDSRTGFSGTQTVTTHIPVADRQAPDARGWVLVSRVETVTASTRTTTHRTYIDQRDDSGRETRRRTIMVTSGVEGAATGGRTTAYSTDGGSIVITYVGAAVESASMTTRVATAANGAVTTEVRNGPVGAGELVTSTERTVAADGTVTVAVTGGPDADADMGHPADGTTVTTATSADGETVTITTSTGTGENRVASRVEVRDENGATTRLTTYENNRLTQKVVSTAYMGRGASTVTTVTNTRAAADGTFALSSTVVVTNDVMGREILRVARDADGDETDRRVSTYAADGSRTEMRTLSGGTGDMLTNTGVREWNAMGVPTRDVVVHPGVQNHAMVTADEHAMIMAGVAAKENAKTVMGPPIMTLRYENDDAFNGAVMGNEPAAGGVDFEMELLARPVTCGSASAGCTFQGLHFSVQPYGAPEVRVYDAGTTTRRFEDSTINAETDDLRTLSNPRPRGGYHASQLFNHWSSWSRRADARESENVLLKLMADVLDVGGTGVSAASTESADDEDFDNEPYDSENNDPTHMENQVDGEPGVPYTSYGGTVTIKSAAMGELDEGTFVHLKTDGLARGVAGIGQQMKRIDSYLALGGSRGDDNDIGGTGDDADAAVAVEVQNYFGWMANSMFTVRRVTATGVTGSDYDWVQHSRTPDASDAIRVYVGMASGAPSPRPLDRSAGSVTDPGTWAGEMIGVGTVQGERYRGRALVAVDFNDNTVDTTFSGISLAQDSAADRAAYDARAEHVHGSLVNGIKFESTGSIARDGSFASRIVAADRPTPLDSTDLPGIGTSEQGGYGSMSSQFYGTDAAEVAGTFNAFGLGLGKTGLASEDQERGDIVGAFGATRDPMPEASSGN